MPTVILLLFLSSPFVKTSQAGEIEQESCPLIHSHSIDHNVWLFPSRVTTWSSVEVECPVCKTTNVFMQWMSYGNYIYQWPSKYQLIFWPDTESPAWYSCKKCRLTTFMEDFKSIPKEKIPALQEMLKGVNLQAQKDRGKKESMEHPPYMEIPTSARMVVAENVYRVLGRNEDQYWGHFYRVMGYHFDAEENQTKADEARRKALAITERVVADKAQEGIRKEALYVSGAMKHFLRDDVGALRDFEGAKALKYSNKDLKDENNKGYNEYLSKLIDEYIEMLHKSEGPRTKKKGGDH